MKLFVFCDNNRPIIPGMKADVEVCESPDISQKVDYFYSQVEAFGFLETCESDLGLDELMNKVCKNGSLKIQGIDIYQVVQNLSKGEISCTEFSQIAVINKQRAVSLHNLVDKIKARGDFNLEYAGLSGLNYILEAKRI
tara:strand:- start:113 stop:529 length:417 start_codon:yes stop_codon:yes gene_type:complete